MFSIKEVLGTPRLHVYVNLLFRVWLLCYATPLPADTGQWINCDRCQLTITWMFSIKEVLGTPRLHVYVNLLFGVWLLCYATPLSASPSRIYAHHTHEKINSWVCFSFLPKYKALLGSPLGRLSSTIQIIGQF